MNNYLLSTCLVLISCSITLVSVLLAFLLRHISKSFDVQTCILQSHDLREYVDQVTEKIIRIGLEQNNNDTSAITKGDAFSELESMLSDVLREEGLDPLKYDIKSLLLATLNRMRSQQLL